VQNTFGKTPESAAPSGFGEKEEKMTKYPASIILDFKGGMFKRFNTVELADYTGLRRIRRCLQKRRPVIVLFDGSIEPVRARYVNFLRGMSGYFGAELKAA
jgi:hypothetical protein